MVLIAGVLGFGIWVYEYWAWTPLQRWYWFEYQVAQQFPTLRGNYRIISKSDRNGHHSLATDTDLVPVLTGQKGIPFELSEQARQRGAVQLFLDNVQYSNAEMKQILAAQIFADQSPDDMIRPAWVGALGFLVVGLIFAIPRDRARGGKDHETRLKGPEKVTVREFNRQSGGDGISFLTTESKQSLSIPRSLESSHMMMMGDTGAGKSVLQRRVLAQIAERGETAIVYDPALEHTPQFFNPARGDLILNPLDIRCPYWSPSDEVIHEAESLTLATSLFPEKPRENTFSWKVRERFSHTCSH